MAGRGVTQRGHPDAERAPRARARTQKRRRKAQRRGHALSTRARGNVHKQSGTQAHARTLGFLWIQEPCREPSWQPQKWPFSPGSHRQKLRSLTCLLTVPGWTRSRDEIPPEMAFSGPPNIPGSAESLIPPRPPGPSLHGAEITAFWHHKSRARERNEEIWALWENTALKDFFSTI